MRARRSLVIRRNDHVGDPIGMAFLESPETDGDAVLARLREYLGDKLKLVKAEVSRAPEWPPPRAIYTRREPDAGRCRCIATRSNSTR